MVGNAIFQEDSIMRQLSEGEAILATKMGQDEKVAKATGGKRVAYTACACYPF